MKKTLLAVALLFSMSTVSFAQHDSIPAQQKKSRPKSMKYTCPMHKDVITSKPGTCPKCGMKLVAMKAPKKKTTEKMDTTM